MNLNEWKQLCGKAWEMRLNKFKQTVLLKYEMVDILIEIVIKPRIQIAPLKRYLLDIMSVKLCIQKNKEDLEKTNELVSLKYQLKALNLQDRLGKQNIHEDLQKLFDHGNLY